MSTKPRPAAVPPRKRSTGARSVEASSVQIIPPKRLGVILASAVVAVHVLLALAAFNPAPHTGGDNAGYITLARSLLETGTYTESWDPAGLPHTKYPPVFAALLALWMLLGAKTWVALKSVPMLFSALSVLFAYLWAAGRRGPTFGAAVALLVGVSSATIDGSHWVLSDPPFVAFTLLALWAFERGRPRGAPAAVTSRASAPSGGAASAAAASRAAQAGAPDGFATPRSAGAFTLLGCAAALLAYFTRSAGIPLLVAVAACLLLHRRWRALVAYAVGAGVPLLLWWLRTRRVGQATYVNEFWLVDPYDPSLGRIAPMELVGRFGVNLVGYVTRHVPGGIVGAQGGWVAGIGVLLVALAVFGWVRAVLRDVEVAELFVPIYVGLIFVWPAVWSGDRFALPLYALLFFYAGDALLALGSRMGRGAPLGFTLVAFSFVAVLALGAWTRSVSTARICRSAAALQGPFGCWGPRVNEFVRVAMWSRTALPEGSAVLSRKPRIYYVMSGVRSRTFPFSIDPEVLLAEARASGAHYVLLDQWDGQAMRYVGEAIAQRPDAFCAVGGFDPREGAVGTLLLGIRTDLPPVPAGIPPTQISLERCPPEMLGDVAAPIPTYSSSSIPLLTSSRGAEP